MHTIRLRGPWQVEPLARFVLQSGGSYGLVLKDLPPPARATMPADWSETLGPRFLGRVRYRRNFQKPTGLESGERVLLLVEPPVSRGEVILNRQRLGDVVCGGEPGRYPVTELLDDHNQLEVVVEHPALDASGAPDDDGDAGRPGGLVGEVRLEIEE